MRGTLHPYPLVYCTSKSKGIPSGERMLKTREKDNRTITGYNTLNFKY
jgi:hypothetical protein